MRPIIFPNDSYDKEDIYELLKRNQHHLNGEEKQAIENIVAKGPQGRKEGEGEEEKAYWQLR
jgi:hypothetical protein